MNKIKVVAFGDSLTVGYQSPTIENPFFLETPYVDFIAEKTGKKIEFILKGISGELTEEMLRRFDRDVISYKPNYVIILGGSNDIGWGIALEVIADNLFTMYDLAMKAGIIPIAVTVPSISGNDPLIRPRVVVNNLIINHCISKNITYIDLFKASSQPNTLRLEGLYSNDGLHLSTAGYKLLADLLYKDVFEKI
jgi:lysophospholipase L1-like esterase